VVSRLHISEHIYDRLGVTPGVAWRRPRRRRAEDGLPAAVVTPQDPRWIEMTRGVNRRWRAYPGSVWLPTTTRHVLSAVRDALRRGDVVTVRSGGQCDEDWVCHREVDTIIDLSQMTQVGYDARHNAISVEAGASLMHVLATLYRAWGVALPVAACSGVAVGGHVVGGGYGMLSRLHGLAVDYLYGVEVVVVDKHRRARVVTATREPRDPHRDLWWAHTGGGGGNFGVVTRYLFRGPGVRGRCPSEFLPRPPAEMYVASVGLNWSDVTETSFVRLVSNFGAWQEAHSAADGECRGLFGTLKLTKRTTDQNHRSVGQIGLVVYADATTQWARHAVEQYVRNVFERVSVMQRPLVSRTGVHEPMPQLAGVVRLPWLRATQQLTASVADRRSDIKSAYHRVGYTPQQAAVLFRWLTDRQYHNPNALVQLDSYGGAVNGIAAEQTAESHRDSVMVARYQTYWSDPFGDSMHRTWLRGLYQAVYAETGGVPVAGVATQGCSVNYPDADLSNPVWNTSGVAWSTLYYGGNYPRLQEVKRRYDPCGVFWHHQAIEAA
jgi:hypothetical protein